MIPKGKHGLIKSIEDSFLELLYIDALRGFDSTGVICVDNHGGFGIMKQATEAALFIPQLRTSEMFRYMWNNGKAIIGHNRKKTIGEITDEQAHPFVVDGTFAMVHNGTIHSYKSLDKAAAKTDSEALTMAFKECFDDELMWKDKLEEVLGKVQYGAYATAMYNQKTEKVHFLRNKERPLWLVYTSDAIYFASEPMMATLVLCRNGYKYKELEVHEVKEHVLVTVDLLTNKVEEETLVPKKPHQASYTPKTIYPGGTTNMGGTANKGMSKSAFKFFRRKWLGERVSFWVDDYVERSYPKTLVDGETEVFLFAGVDEIKQPHSLGISVDLKQFGFKTADDIFDQRWCGVVEAIDYNDESGEIKLWLDNVKPIITYKPSSTYYNKSRTEVETLLSEKSLMVLNSELQSLENKLCKWEKDCYEAAIKKRKQELEKVTETYHELGKKAVLDEAERDNITLVEELDFKKGVCRLIHPTKGIVYESPIVLQ